ncbi:hypothetical protein P4200_32510 [Pseudomonas aeruginosa]|nr:hypothetical protein [Pseudomonas aeruginosa]
MQAADRSNASAPTNPRRAATLGAVAGQQKSPVLVASTTASTRSSPAEASAAEAARRARSPLPRSPAICRWRTPVRLLIQASEVSSSAASMSLLSTASGR